MDLRDELCIELRVWFFDRQLIQIVPAKGFAPALLRMRAVDCLAGSDPVRPCAHPPWVTQGWKLPGNHPERLLQNVFRCIGVANDGADMLVERILKRRQHVIERLSVAGLCPRDEEQLASALGQGALIDSRALSTRPTEREM